jgi:hypothetical protein
LSAAFFHSLTEIITDVAVVILGIALAAWGGRIREQSNLT